MKGRLVGGDRRIEPGWPLPAVARATPIGVGQPRTRPLVHRHLCSGPAHGHQERHNPADPAHGKPSDVSPASSLVEPASTLRPTIGNRQASRPGSSGRRPKAKRGRRLTHAAPCVAGSPQWPFGHMPAASVLLRIHTDGVGRFAPEHQTGTIARPARRGSGPGQRVWFAPATVLA